MATLKKYDLAGKELGSIEVSDALLEVKAHSQSIKDYLVAIRNNKRQWSASTKTRAEINRTGRKPHPQKGGGRSRQGDLAAPQYKGGGIVFGPRPKFDIHVRINKKERRAAIAALVASKIKEGKICVLQDVVLKKPKTEKFATFFEKVGIDSQRVLILSGARGVAQDDQLSLDHCNLIKSFRNIPKKEYAAVSQINGYALARSQQLVILEPALEQFLAILGAS